MTRAGTAAIVLAAALLVEAAAGPADARRAHRRAPKTEAKPLPTVTVSKPIAGQGRVEFVTDKRAYLDHGADGGLVTGQTVALFRNGRATGNCTVDNVAGHSASCTGARAHVGDTFRLGKVARQGAAKPATALPLVIAEEALQADAQAIAQATVEKVDFTGKARFGTRQTVSFSAGYASWTTGSDAQSDFGQERIDGSLRVRLGETGVHLAAAFSALRWQSRPATTRFRPNQDTQFYLWEAELARTDPDARTVLAVGRLWPWHTPGLSVLDGIQIGRQNEARTIAWGGYAGLIPDVLSLAPATDAWAGGLYGALTQAGGKADVVSLAREEARLGIRHLPVVGLITEAEMLAQVWLGWSTVGASSRVVSVPGSNKGPALSRGAVDLRARPLPALSAGLHLRYFGAAVAGEQALLQNASPSLQGGYHAAGDAQWDPLSWLGVSVFADLNRDAESGWAGRDGTIELRLPRLLGDFGGLWLGGEGAEGWLRSRTVYLQVLGHMRERLRVIGRVSATASEFLVPQSNLNTQELDSFVQIDGNVFTWLRLSGRALVRAPLAFAGEAIPTGPSLVLNVDATGVF